MKTVLIVDDDEQNLYLLKTLFEANGFSVALAHNGAEALDMARQSQPDIAVSDILMPMMDGFSMLREWHSDQHLTKIPVIIYTATYTDPADQELALKLGAARFIIKPTEPDQFIAEVRQVMAAYVAGTITVAKAHFDGNQEYFRMYNEALIRKLEKKMLDLAQETEQRRRSEEQVQKLAAEWQVTFDAIEDGICVLDRSQKITRYNKSFLKFAKVKKDEIIGNYCWQVVHGTSEPLADCPVIKVQSSLQRESLMLELYGKILFVTVDPVFDNTGALCSAVHIIRDITELKRNEQTLRSRLDELERWKNVTLDRESRVLELKQEVNELSQKLGKPPRYGPDAKQ